MNPGLFPTVLTVAALALHLVGGAALLAADQTDAAAPPPATSKASDKKSKPSATTLDADQLFGLTNLWNFHLKIDPEAWNAMEPSLPTGPRRGGPPVFPNDYKFAHATLEFEGQPVGEIAVRFKGNSSFKAARDSLKRSFKLDFNRFVKGQKFCGLIELNLNNNAMDPAQMREALAYEIFRQAGLPAPRTAFARLYLTVPGQHERQYVGLYTLVEQVDERFLKDRFGTKKGLLLKPERIGGLEYLGEDWAPYERRYEPKTNVSAEEARRLIDFTRLVQQANDKTFAEQIGAFLDVEQCLSFYAVQAALANLDSPLFTGHNYYLYLHAPTGRFHFLPWDLNEAFGGFFPAGSAEEQMNLSITRPFRDGNKLIDQLLAMPGKKEDFRRRFESLLAAAFSKERIFADIAAIQKVIRPAVTEDPTASLEGFERSLSESPASVPTEPWGAEARANLGQREPGRRPFGGPRPPRPLLKQFVARRVESIRAQLDGKAEGYVPRGRFGPGGGPFGGGPGEFLAPPLMRAADADRDTKLSRAEFADTFKRWFNQWDTDQSGLLDEAKLTAGLREALPPPEFDGPRGPQPGPPPPEAPGLEPRDDRRRELGGPDRRARPLGRRPGDGGPISVVVQRFLKAADTSQDRMLSRDEWERASEKWFAEWDTDHSGSLDLPKVATGFNKLIGPPPGFGP